MLSIYNGIHINQSFELTNKGYTKINNPKVLIRGLQGHRGHVLLEGPFFATFS